MSDNKYNPVTCNHILPNGFSAWQFQSEEQSNLGGQNKVSIHVCMLCGEISIGGYRPSKDETHTNSFHEVFHICHPDAIDAIIKQANYYNEGVKWGRLSDSAPDLKNSVEEQWESFWKGIVTNEDGTINIEQVKKELYDFSFILEHVPKVYCHITGNKMSKVMYHADTVISVADEYFNEQMEQALKEEREDKDDDILMRPEDHEQVEINKAAGMPEYEASFQSGYTAGHDAGYKKGERESLGAVWVKASDINIEYRKTYYAKWPSGTVIKSTGWFQESDGTFFWNEQGYIPVLKKEHHMLLILDETTPTVRPKEDAVLPADDAIQNWFEENIDKECSASSAIYKFRLWLASLQNKNAAAGSGKEEAVKFVEWVRSYCPQIYNGWMHDGKQYTTAQLYDIYKQQNK